jgi:DNA-binding response OmpR family regulator
MSFEWAGFETASDRGSMELGVPGPCMIAEDKALVGLSLQVYLEEMGLDVCGPLSSEAEALAWLTANTPAIAILDYALKDGPCIALIRTLQERGIPFVIYSGHERNVAPPELRHVPWMTKPCAREVLLAALIHAAPALSERLSRAA